MRQFAKVPVCKGAVHLCSHTLLSVQALRGRLWQIFLCLDGKREAGMYEQLVQKALGNTKYGRKVLHIHLPLSRRFVLRQQAFICWSGQARSWAYGDIRRLLAENGPKWCDQLLQGCCHHALTAALAALSVQRSQTSGEAEANDIHTAPSTEAPSSYRSQHSSSDGELHTSAAYAPAAASAPAAEAAVAAHPTADSDAAVAEPDTASGGAVAAGPAAGLAADGDSAMAEASAPKPVITARRTVSTGRLSVSGSETGR